MQWLSQINQCNRNLWQRRDEKRPYPFLSTEFLHALEASESVGGKTGWTPHYLSNSQNSSDQNWVIPAYIKQHSYGEYVFDWSWANAYEQHGYDYYPKLLIAAPFTPVPGPRGIGLSESDLSQLLPEIEQHCLEQRLSSAHYLFASTDDQLVLNHSSWHRRRGVQFHWFNRDYENFEHFLSHFKSRKRKTIKKERAAIGTKDIRIEHKNGNNITQEDWAFFYYCYQSTYLKRGMQGYLTQSAFKEIANTLPDQTLLMMAYDKDHSPIACALYFADHETLYGRYWGCLNDIPGLHFELCYYQGIEYCIKHGLKQFNPGTQGEHKISRGFEPTSTYSYHWIAHPDFSRAIGNFVQEEAIQMEHYHTDCEALLPFNESFK